MTVPCLACSAEAAKDMTLSRRFGEESKSVGHLKALPPVVFCASSQSVKEEKRERERNIPLNIHVLFPVRDLAIQKIQSLLEDGITKETESNGEGSDFDNHII